MAAWAYFFFLDKKERKNQGLPLFLPACRQAGTSSSKILRQQVLMRLGSCLCPSSAEHCFGQWVLKASA
jgi:hypothetical protein